MPAFQYRLILKDGSPADPPVFTTATPHWREGDTFMSRPGRTFRILAINDSGDDCHAEWTVEVELENASSANLSKRLERSGTDLPAPTL